MSDQFIQGEAQRILDRFITVSFEQCHPLSRDFKTVPFIDRLNPDDVGVVTEVLRGSRSLLYLLDIEATMIQIVRPSYNIVIRQSKED